MNNSESKADLKALCTRIVEKKDAIDREQAAFAQRVIIPLRVELNELGNNLASKIEEYVQPGMGMTIGQQLYDSFSDFEGFVDDWKINPEVGDKCYIYRCVANPAKPSIYLCIKTDENEYFYCTYSYTHFAAILSECLNGEDRGSE